MAWLAPRAHGTPTMKGMEADDLLCSRNARGNKKVSALFELTAVSSGEYADSCISHFKH